MLIKRNLLLYFRDKSNVFFSLLAVFIIIALYVLFLGDLMRRDLESQLGFASDKTGVVMASVTLAGMIAVTSITSSLGALSVSVADKGGAASDFLTSPARRGKISLGYLLGSGTVGLIMTFMALILCEAYIVANGGFPPTFYDCWRLALTTVLSASCGVSIAYFASLFINTQSAFAAFSTVVGTLIGFLMGIYIPIGTLPKGVQWVIKCFPMSHAAGMFRQVMADAELKALFGNAPPQALEEFRIAFGIVFDYGGAKSAFWISAAVLAATALLFGSLSAAVLRNASLPDKKS